MTRPITNDNGVHREMTQDEYDAYLATVQAAEAHAAARRAAADAAAAAKESAKAKLAALGLTEAEVNAIIGGV